MSIQRIAVVGTGQMGRGIVEACANAGLQAIAIKATGGDLDAVRAKFAKSVDRRMAKGKITHEEHDAILARIEVVGELSAVADADLVIESALEDMDVKSKLVPEIESHMSEGAILASNTSSLPLLDLTKTVARPEQFLALHFFNPAQVMKLVEIGVTPETAPGVIASCAAFCTTIGKTGVEVSASPGYIVNRLLVPYMIHAIETVEAGIADPAAVDTAMKLGAGHPMGPLALADLIGLDVVTAMANTMAVELEDARYRIPTLLAQLVGAGALGRKSSIGFFDYSGAHPVPNPNLLPRVAEAAE